MALVETVLAVAFIFAFLSLIASSIKELIENFVQKRKKDMRGAILDLLGESGGRTLFKSQLMNAITSQDSATANPDVHTHWPSYLDATTFARAVSTMLNDAAFRRLWEDSHLGRAVASLAAGGQDLVKSIETIYEQRMERVEGSFKRNAQVWLFAIGLALAVALDADSLSLIARIRADSALRSTVVAVATKYSTAELAGGLCPPDKPGTDGSTQYSLQKISNCVDESLPGLLGWTEERKRTVSQCGSPLLMALLGYLLTAAAVSLGAPFWFDVLSKVSNLRATMKSPEKSDG